MTDKEFLKLIPVKNCEYEINNGIVTVFYVRPVKSIIDKLFFRTISQKPSKIDLDEIGSYIWTLIDEKKDVKEIISQSQNHFDNKIAPAEERVIMFIKQMAGTKLIELYKKR